MSLTSLVTLAATGSTTGSGAGIFPWLVGIGVLVLLLAIMGALLAFGAGRPHS